MQLEQNRAQEEAISSIEGPLILIACPGSGKTTTLIRRILYMTNHRIDPQHILMVTFTNAAAAEMKKRYVQMKGEPGVTFSTIHALCYRLLLAADLVQADHLLAESEALEYMTLLLRNEKAINDPFETAADVMQEISLVQNMEDVRLDSYRASCCEDALFRRLYLSYRTWKEENGRFDFDDILLLCRTYLREDADALAACRRRYRYIQVDEYQDINPVQRDILYLLAGESKNLCVCGDDDQSIYGFRGAKPKIMLDFEWDFDHAKKIIMDRNYRSNEAIVEIASDVIEKNIMRFEKQIVSARGRATKKSVTYREFESKDDQMTYLKNEIQRLREAGMPYEEMAILLRTGKQEETPVRMLSAFGIPYHTSEKIKTIYDSWIYRIIQTYVKLSVGQGGSKDLLYCLNRPMRYLSPSVFEQVPFKREQMLAALGYLKKDQEWKYVAAYEKMTLWMQNFGPGALKASDPASVVFDRLTGPGSIDFDIYLKEYAELRKADLAELTEEYELLKADAKRIGSIGDWIRYAYGMQQKIAAENKEKKTGGVTISTMHRAKGLEYGAVFLPDLNEAIVPHRKSMGNEAQLEEERRLLYVAMTRAKDRLYLMNYGKVSRFVSALFETRRKSEIEERIPVPPAGTKVRHKRFGEGVVRAMQNGRLEVEFGTETKKFLYPDCVKEGFLELFTEK